MFNFSNKKVLLRIWIVEQFKPTKFTTLKKKDIQGLTSTMSDMWKGMLFYWQVGENLHATKLQLGFCWVKTSINYPSWGKICNNIVCKKKYIKLGFRPQDNFAIQKWPIYMYLFNPLNLLSNFILKQIYSTLIVKFGWRWVCQIFRW